MTPEFGAEAPGKALVEETKLMFRWWHELKEGGFARSGFQERIVIVSPAGPGAGPVPGGAP